MTYFFIHFFFDRGSSLRCASVVGNLANLKSISGDIDRDYAECRANKSADDGVGQVNWLELLSTKQESMIHEEGKNSFPT